MIQTLVRKFGGLVDIQGWFPGAVLARRGDNTGFEWVVMSGGGGGAPQVNSDWDAVSGVAVILNKPTIPTQYTDAMAILANASALSLKVDKVTGKALSTNDFTDVFKTKLEGIAIGAEQNVNADWNAVSGDAQILNKPTIPTALSQLSTDATHRLVTDTNISTWNGKQDPLGFTPVPTTTTVNGQALSSNITLDSTHIGYTDPTYNNVKLALDQHSALLGLLAPAKPVNLSTCTLSISGTYTARESSTGTVRSGVINSTTPTATVSAPFYNGDSGTLTATVDGGASGSRVLTTADDSGTYTSLRILTDVDPYVGQFGKQGFWKQLTASIVPSPALSLKVAHTLQMTHSDTGSTPAITVYCDNPSSPTISAQSVGTVTHTSNKRLSGVPCLTTGDTIQVRATANNAVFSFYNNSQIVRFSGTNITTLNYMPGSPPASGAAVATGFQNVVVSSGYTANAQVTCTAYNSAGTTGTGNIGTGARISVSASETIRVKSGSTDMPASGYGAAYDSSELLTANSELQLDIDSLFKYPPATNYTAILPAGPNYSVGLGTSDRYATFDLGAFSGTARTITINGSSNFGSSALIAGVKMWVKVEGSTGWVDINAAYPGVGNPVNNGDAALVIASSTATSRAVTFGSVVRSGTLYVRIALPSGSTKTFTSVS